MSFLLTRSLWCGGSLKIFARTTEGRCRPSYARSIGARKVRGNLRWWKILVWFTKPAVILYPALTRALTASFTSSSLVLMGQLVFLGVGGGGPGFTGLDAKAPTATDFPPDTSAATGRRSIAAQSVLVPRSAFQDRGAETIRTVVLPIVPVALVPEIIGARRKLSTFNIISKGDGFLAKKP
jgi:hypothetical protein